MDSRQQTDSDYTQTMADDEMQVDTALVPESYDSLAEVEMLPLDDSSRLNGSDVVDGESHATPRDASASEIPPLSSTLLSQFSPERTGTRRTRVEDDHDDERDRRHPSHRISSPSHPLNTASPSSSQPTSIPTDTGPGLSGLASFNSRPFRFFQHMTSHSNDNSALPTPLHAPQRVNVDAGDNPATESAAGPTPLSDAGNTGPAPTPQQNPQPGNVRHQYLGGFAITIDVNGRTTTMPLSEIPNMNRGPNTANTPSTGPRDEEPQPQNRTHEQPHQPQQPEQSQQPPPPPPPPPRYHPEGMPFPGGGPGAFADLLTRIGLLAALSFQSPAFFEREVDDPERAKKLIEELEDVPVGLIRRLERVGKNGNEEEEGGLGDGGCAVCWERLLFEGDDHEYEEGIEEKAAKEEANVTDQNLPSAEISPDSGDDVPPSLPSLGSSTTSASETEQKEKSSTEKKYQRVVSLPCAHVFHAACLVPWFSKPRQTTCPICRFNIDPENLTYNPSAQRRAAAAERAQAQEDLQAEAGEAQGQDRERPEAVGDEPEEAGIDIPLIFGGGLPSKSSFLLMTW